MPNFTVTSHAEKYKEKPSNQRIQNLYNIVQQSMPDVTVENVVKVTNNQFLHAAFQVKKAEYKLKYKQPCPTEELYHATGAGNVQSILRQNLDWRRVIRSKYGIGVSFSDSPQYANKYCNDQNGDYRALIVCEVIIGKQLKVKDNYHYYPKNMVDSYRSVTNRVVVKFEDNTFYPKYVVYYNLGYSESDGSDSNSTDSYESDQYFY